MSEEFVLGIDLGTSGVKVVLVPAQLSTGTSTPIEATVEYPLSIPQPGWSEQNPEDWWRATTEAIHAVIDLAGIPGSRVAGLALSGQMHGATLLDGHAEILRPCILWNDQRSA